MTGERDGQDWMRLVWDGQEQYADVDENGQIVLQAQRPATPLFDVTEVVGQVKDISSANILAAAPAHTGLAGLRADPRFTAMASNVRVAYLDPPYNTGRTFNQYRDRSERGAWLTMLRDTMVAVRDSLRPDGCMWLHLDDREVHRARLVADEVFGEGQFVADVVWERKRKPSFLHAQIAQVTDHLLVYARDRSQLARFTDDAAVTGRKVPLHHATNATGVLRLAPGTVTFGFSDRTVPAGDMSTATVPTELLEDLVVRDGRNVTELVMSGSFRFTQARLDAEVGAGRAVHVPRLPLRPHMVIAGEGRTWTTLFTRATGMRTNESAKAHSAEIFGVPFDTPKPEELLARIVSSCTDPGDVVLDVFAGSATTSATAHKLGRSWIALEVNPKVLREYAQRRLTKVVEGGDPSGISRLVHLSPRFPLPDAMTARDARRAGEWVSAIARGGGLDDLDATVSGEVVARVRTESTRTRTEDVWSGGGGFVILTAGGTRAA